jgi:hypothetical protein
MTPGKHWQQCLRRNETDFLPQVTSTNYCTFSCLKFIFAKVKLTLKRLSMIKLIILKLCYNVYKPIFKYRKLQESKQFHEMSIGFVKFSYLLFT